MIETRKEKIMVDKKQQSFLHQYSKHCIVYGYMKTPDWLRNGYFTQ